MTAPELKPCPFCGGNASISKDHDPDGNGAFYAIKCRKCRAKSSEIYAVETCSIHFAQVRDAWNRRADLAAVQPAHVLVKPLVWGAFGKECVRAESPFGLYDVMWGFGRELAYLTHCGKMWKHPTIEAAKAVAQADYEARILAALEPKPEYEQCWHCAGSGMVIGDGGDPSLCHYCHGDTVLQIQDPRDEVSARLVEAMEQFLIEYDEVDLAVHEPKSLTDAVYEARAALAAAKAVQK